MMARDGNDREVRFRKARVHGRPIGGFLVKRKDRDSIGWA